MTTNEQRSQALSAAGERRVELKEAVSKTERAAASPTAMPSWRDYVLSELEGLRIALDQHVEEVEGAEGRGHLRAAIRPGEGVRQDGEGLDVRGEAVLPDHAPE